MTLIRYNRFSDFVVYALCYLLLLEWIRPLDALDVFDNGLVLVVYAALCFIITGLNLPTLIAFLFKGLLLLLFIDQMFIDALLFTEPWRQAIVDEWVVNQGAIASQSWYLITPAFQMALFFMLMALISYLLYFWAVSMKRVFIFAVLTIVYVTIMDTFTVYELAPSMVLLAITVLTLILINGYNKWSGDVGGLPLESILFRFILPFGLLVIGSVLLATRLPVNEPIWPDPVPFLTRQDAQERTVGYGEDDSLLGGDFNHNDTPVFIAEIENPNYWRIESKDVYTGHGWEESLIEEEQAYHLEVPIHDTNVRVNYLEGATFDRLVHPYNFSGVHTEEITFSLNTFNDRLTASDDLRDLDVYIRQDELELSESTLRLAGTHVPNYMVETALQLPETLPNRVHELAQEITEGHETNFDKAIAIERYFATDGFEYQTNNIPVPREGQDYVDQFLFETRRGYCDNFSTAMVVLLRSVGVPARWAKGFTAGEEIDGPDLYEVRQDNAHSWVEVYFEGSGWVPFEPTIGFGSSPAIEQPPEIDSDFEWDDDAVTPDPEDESSEDPFEDIPEEDEMESPLPTEEAFEQDQIEIDEGTGTEGASSFRLPWWATLLIVGLVTLALLLFVDWKGIVHKRLLKRYLPLVKTKDFLVLYEWILTILTLKTVVKQKNESLTQFASRVDQYFLIDAMTPLTDYYVKLLYSSQKEIENREQMEADIRRILNRILS